MSVEPDDILALLEDVRQRKVLVVVEGLKDRRALEGFGIARVMTLDRPLFEVVEQIARQAKEVILLTDLDSEGKKLYRVLARDLQKHGVKVDNRLRVLLLKTKLRHVEGLRTFMRNLICE